MARFYGTLSSNKGKDKTKTGSSWVRATAQSWDGSVSVRLEQVGLETVVEVRISHNSTSSPDALLFKASLTDLQLKGTDAISHL
jgi:hypothetical protein